MKAILLSVQPDWLVKILNFDKKLYYISQATLAKLSKGENVTTDVLERICKL